MLDINDNDPVLLNLPMNLTLSENAPVSSFVTRVLARDADKGPNALLTFDITAGNTENAFYINSTVRPRGGGMPGCGAWAPLAPEPCLPWAPMGAIWHTLPWQEVPRGKRSSRPLYLFPRIFSR